MVSDRCPLILLSILVIIIIIMIIIIIIIIKIIIIMTRLQLMVHHRIYPLFSSPELKAQGELIVWDSSQRPSVRASTLSNMNTSEISWSIIIKFRQEHHWGGGLTALGFG